MPSQRRSSSRLRSSAAKKIQKRIRGKQTRKQVTKLRASRKIQSRVRGKQTRKVIKRVRTNMLTNNDCSICLEPLTQNVATALPCGHRFHKDCIVNWLSRSQGKCPNCKQRITNIPYISIVEPELEQEPEPEYEPLILDPILRRQYILERMHEIELWEREKFVSENHLYLIEQVQYNNPSFFVKNTRSPMIDLNFNHPAKEVVWVVQREDIGKRSKDIDVDFSYGNDWFNYSCYRSRIKNIIKDPFDSAYLMFNGQNRSAPLPAIYYRLYQTYQYHTKTPSNYIYVNSFACKPEDHQPSGSLNMSRIDTSVLNITMNAISLKCFICE